MSSLYFTFALASVHMALCYGVDRLCLDWFFFRSNSANLYSFVLHFFEVGLLQGSVHMQAESWLVEENAIELHGLHVDINVYITVQYIHGYLDICITYDSTNSIYSVLNLRLPRSPLQVHAFATEEISPKWKRANKVGQTGTKQDECDNEIFRRLNYSNFIL